MSKLEEQINSLVKEHGVMTVIESLVENFDSQADFAHLSGDKKEELNYRKVAIILFEALRKIDSV